MITRCFTNVTVNLHHGPKEIRYNICHIQPYISDTNFEDINPGNICENVNIRSPVIYFTILLKLGNKLYNMVITGSLMLDYILRAREFYYDGVIFFK